MNALLPGGTDATMPHQMNSMAEALHKVAQLHALNRIPWPHAIAEAALFQTCEAALCITVPRNLVDWSGSISRDCISRSPVAVYGV